VQDTFLRAYRALPGFKGEAKFSSWLYRIALNLCRDWVRRQRRTPTVQVPEGIELSDLASEQGPVESIEDLVARREMSRAVAVAMTRLPEEQRSSSRNTTASRFRRLPTCRDVPSVRSRRGCTRGCPYYGVISTTAARLKRLKRRHHEHHVSVRRQRHIDLVRV
jgi:sigma-70-like protein